MYVGSLGFVTGGQQHITRWYKYSWAGIASIATPKLVFPTFYVVYLRGSCSRLAKNRCIYYLYCCWTILYVGEPGGSFLANIHRIPRFCRTLHIDRCSCSFTQGRCLAMLWIFPWIWNIYIVACNPTKENRKTRVIHWSFWRQQEAERWMTSHISSSRLYNL